MTTLVLYLKPFLIALALSLVLSILIIKFTKKKLLISFNNQRIDKRHIHNKNKAISRWGGVAIAIAFIIPIFWDENLTINKTLWGIIFGGVFILVAGAWDDIKELNWKTQLFLQTCSVALLFIFGAKINYITNPLGGAIQLDTPEKFFGGIIMGVIWSLILINAMNWLDGIDGLSGGVAFIGAVTIFVLSLKPEVNQPPVGIISLALAGSLLGFLFFNFYPAKIMAGTGGAFLMGFILAGLSVFAGTKIATTLLVLAIPIIDFFWVIGERIKAGKSIFEADQEHLHHKLMRIGWSQTKIALFFYGVTILIAIVALNTGAGGKIVIALLLAFFSGIFFYIISNRKNLNGIALEK